MLIYVQNYDEYTVVEICLKLKTVIEFCRKCEVECGVSLLLVIITRSGVHCTVKHVYRECMDPKLKSFGGKAAQYSPRARVRHWLG